MIFERTILKNLALNITDGEHASVIDDPNGDYFLLSNKNIVDGYIKYDQDLDRKISKSTFDKISKRTKLAKNDVLISTVGSIGKLTIIRDQLFNYTFQRSVGIIKCDTTKLLPEYLYYYLKQNLVQKRLINVSKGAVQKCLFINDLDNFLIDFPISLDDQQKIASILSTLDAKIELNNRINAKLEEMAKTLYDYWFVQFDFPNSDGKPYKASGGKMVWNKELKREIPDGWEVSKINKYVTIGSGYPFDSETYIKSENGNYKVVTIKNVQDGFLDMSSVEHVLSIPRMLSNFCILSVGDILMSLTGNVGRMCFVDRSNLLMNQRVGKLIGDKDMCIYTYFYFGRPENQKRLSMIANGSSQLNLSPIETVKDYYTIPPKYLLKKFLSVVNPMIDKTLINKQENQKLTEIRDTLLPLLMNGQVKVN